MKIMKTEMTETECDALVITTNGFVSSAGKAVMGRGIAKQIADLIPRFPYELGKMINKHGNHVHLFEYEPDLITFPVKHKTVIYDGTNVVNHAKHQYKIGDTVAGFHSKADIQLIEQSLKELIELADENPQWKIILIPKVGCGAGELDWDDIYPLMDKYLDDRFICCYK